MTVLRTEGTPEGAVAHPAADVPAELQIRMLTEQEWPTLRDVRLVALRDSPWSFLSNYEQELEYDDERWADEFRRGDWMVASQQDEIVALLGATGYNDIPATDRYLEYLWVTPTSRKSGVASDLIRAMLGRLRANGAAAVWLWILVGNTPAQQLYEKFGFVNTDVPEQVPDGRYEQRMKLVFR
jgi:ribosomal protein S18 acetylase RimI-like enzyme